MGREDTYTAACRSRGFGGYAMVRVVRKGSQYEPHTVLSIGVGV
jgi:hypothetical protein